MDKDKDIINDTDEATHELTILNVDKGQSPLRVDKFIMNRVEHTTRSKIQTAIKAGTVLVNDKVVKPNHRVKPYDQIKILLEHQKSESSKIIPEDIPLEIVYEDEYLMVISKASGMVVHPGFGNRSGTLVHALAYHIKRDDIPILPGNSIDRPGLVHRLDKDTSGLMVIAKTEYTMSHLAKQFFNHNIDRTYHALVWGTFHENAGTVETFIGRHPRKRVIMSVHPDDGEGGKHAITHYEVIEDMYYVSLIKCKLETGRTHQIRVHMNHIGHQVFSDEKYDGSRVVKGTVYTKYKRFVENCFSLCPRQALHAKSLGFIHPHTEEKMFFESELPEDMSLLLEKWRSYFTNKLEK
ncbi:MAG: RluA family pseudouridine synthase [Saprospiraceae bacterium]